MDDITYATAKDLKTTINYLTALKSELEGSGQSVINLTNRSVPSPTPMALENALSAMEDNLISQAKVLVQNQLTQFQTDFDNL